MIDIDEIIRILSDFKNGRHVTNSYVVMGDSPEMDGLFTNFCDSARVCFGDPNDVPKAFTVMDNTHLSKGINLSV